MDIMINMHKLYKLLPSNDSSKQLILEPLSCILKLAILQWKPIGTKISVLNNSLKYNEPSIVQGITRSLGGDSRQDLHNICFPIIKCLEWYPLSEKDYEFFYKESCKGLLMLKHSYESNSIINHTIDHYIGLLEGKEYESIEDTAVTGEFRNIWSEKEILILKTIVEYIISLEGSLDKQMYLSVLEKILLIKEEKVNMYIQNISTSY
jgi:hypothetical protein